jgi:hypothetical protein
MNYLQRRLHSSSKEKIMALTPSYKPEETEDYYVDKGAVMTPQVNPMVAAKYAAGKAEAASKDKVEWPTSVAGQTDQGM